MISPHLPKLFSVISTDAGIQPVTLVSLTGLGSARPDPGSPQPAHQEAEVLVQPAPERGTEPSVGEREAFTIADFMSRSVVTARADQPLREVVRLLGERRIAGVPVVNDDGEVAGVISQSDIAAHVAESWSELTAAPDPGRFYQSLWIPESDLHERVSAETPVSEVMSPYVLYATPDASLDETAELMLTHGIHRVVVLHQRSIVGIVSSLDLLRAYREASRAGHRL